MENNILQKVREDISAYLDSYKLEKYYKLHGFDYANGEEFDRMLLLTEEDTKYILDHLEENSLVFSVNFGKESIPLKDKINKLVNTTVEYPAVAWDIDLSVFTFPLTFTISEIENPSSLPKNTKQQITVTKEELECLLFATAKFWFGGVRMIAYSEIHACLSKYVHGVDAPYVIFCDTIDSMLTSIVGPYKINEQIYSNGNLEYPDDYNYYRDGGILIKITLSLCGHKLELFKNSLSLDGCKDRIITVNFPELMIKLGHYDRYEAFNKLKSILRDSNYPTDEVLITLLKANGIGYNEELNTSVCIMHSTNSEH